MRSILRGPNGPGERPVATWSALGAIIVFASGYAAGAVLRALLTGPPASSTVRAAGPAVVEVSWTLAILAWLRIRHRGWPSAMGVPDRRWREAHEGAVFGFILYGIVALGVAWPFGRLLSFISNEDVRAPERISLQRPALAVVISVLFALVIAPVAEELFFRGVLFLALRDRYGFGAGVAGSSVAFGLVHWVPGGAPANLVLVVASTAMGAGLAILYERRKSILAPLAAHVAFNLLGLAVLVRTTI